MSKKANQSYDFLIFQELIYEYAPVKQAETEAKIKRRLKYYNLGPYRQERVDHIRMLRNELANEIKLLTRSKYYNKTPSVYAKMEDFDVSQMEIDYTSNYPLLSSADLREMIGWGVHMLYTR